MWLTDIQFISISIVCYGMSIKKTNIILVFINIAMCNAPAM